MDYILEEHSIRDESIKYGMILQPVQPNLYIASYIVIMFLYMLILKNRTIEQAYVNVFVSFVFESSPELVLNAECFL